MATVLISFVGRPPFKEKASREYTPTIYRFGKDEKSDIAASFFGVALLKNLLSQKRNVKRWLLMGTHQSIWQTLLEAVPGDKQEELLEIYPVIADEVAKDGFVKNETLETWENALRPLTETKIFCRLVGDGASKNSQENIWKAIDEAVESGDKIVVDITHGLRHQPIIASFMVMFLRWAKNVKLIEMFYGAFDLKEEIFCPVLELPICNELLKASEAVSTYRQTGNFVKLGESLGLTSGNIEKISFSNEMNQSDKGTASRLLQELEQKLSSLSPIEKSLEPLMKETLDWQGKNSIARVYQRKAEIAFEHQQYFQAIALLWEALLLAGCDKFRIPNPTTFAARREAEEEISKSLNNSDQKTFQIIDYLRNAVMHGTDVEPSKVKNDVEKAIKNQKEFQAIFKKGKKLFKDLLT